MIKKAIKQKTDRNNPIPKMIISKTAKMGGCSCDAVFSMYEKCITEVK